MVNGEIRLAALRFQVPAVDVSYDRGRLTGTVSGDLLRIDTLLLHTGSDQELAAQGTVRLRPLTNPSLDLAAMLRDFQVSNSAQLRARATGQLALGGTFETPIVTGTLRMGRTEFFAGGAAGLAVEDVELTREDSLELARHFGPALLARAGDAAFLDRFSLDLDLRLPEQVWFRRREAPSLNVEVSGRIRLQQEPGSQMRFFGAVEPMPSRSTLDVYGRTFQLTGGEILLRGEVEETLIDVTAEYHVATEGSPDGEGVVINVAATGRPDSIVLEFSSQPEMPRDDMISYIVTGRTASNSPLATGEGDGLRGEELALGQLTEVISRAVGQELGFDVFQIRQDGTRGLMLTAGRYLTPRLFMSLQQPLDVAGQTEQAPGANLGPGFELQYRVQPWLRITFQGGSLPAGMLFRGRYAY
jgi:translocation and assembly module TamB